MELGKFLQKENKKNDKGNKIDLESKIKKLETRKIILDKINELKNGGKKGNLILVYYFLINR